ncbi:MAG TPA: tripartite tricarboxylate transporter substrate binding protein [Burkholderiales bacterium]|jgi:tripartite-type tricarboxylate transporter receptor subunit TctC|nr:tripartite tricarboxylate transporter substrate binding protein [Burkholderiales bacterium]
MQIARLIIAVMLALASASAKAQINPANAQTDPAHARTYPSKAIRIVVPNPPGGTSDILARSIGQKLNEAWGQPVIVENRAGANGNIGANLVAKSPSDGYTLLLTDVGALAISPSVFPDLPFDPAGDFAPVVLISYSPHVLGVHPSVPAKTVKELIALAKASPGELNFATAGVGSAPHLAGVEFALRTGVKWTYVPYKGGSQAVADVIAGHADVLFNGMLPVYPHVKGGRMRALAVSSPKRVAAAPEIPTVAESGLPGFETGSWQGILAPSGTPREIVLKLNAEIRRILGTPEIKAQLADQGTEIRADTPESLGQFIRTEIPRWAKVVKQSGIKVE